MKFLFNDQIDIAKWLKLLDESAFSSPFQTPYFLNFYNSLENGSASVFAMSDGLSYSALMVVTEQKEKGIKSFFSRRGVIYGGGVFIDNINQNIVIELLNEINNYYKNKLIYLECRNYFNYINFKEAFFKSEYKYEKWLNFHLATHDAVLMKKAMSSSRLRQVKKAIKNGVKWQEATTIEQIKDFYKILQELYKNKVKKPLISFEFFKNAFELHFGKFLLVFYEGLVIGGIFCPIHKKRIYEYYVCGKDIEYKDKYPSVMATWAAMEFASQNGFMLFDFMGAGSPSVSYGVRDFKARFGGELVEYGRFITIYKPILYGLGKMGIKLLSKIN